MGSFDLVCLAAGENPGLDNGSGWLRLTQSLGPAWFAQRPGPTFVTESVGFGSGSVDWFQSLPSLARALVCLWVSVILVALRTSTAGTNEKV